MGAVLRSESFTGCEAALRFTRAGETDAPADAALLHARALDPTERDDLASPRLLHPPHAVVERWFGSAPVRHQQDGALRWATDGQLFFGSLTLDEQQVEGGLGQAAEQAYAMVFRTLAQSGFPHLLRVWNYMARINEPTDGLERYRQFNVGRQAAFLEAGRSAFVGSPAACALGTERGPLTVHVLAGRQEPRAVENPRQVSAYHYPAEYGPRTPTFSRAALADLGSGCEGLFISGTASIVGHETLHVGDVHGQTLETIDNLEALIASAVAQSRLPASDAHRMHDLECTVYVRHADDLDAVRRAFEQRVGADSPAAQRAVYLRADVCRSDLLVEIEAHRLGGVAG
jgi:chorismate lyase / 3-hydroxybenzoate synthase